MTETERCDGVLCVRGLRIGEGRPKIIVPLVEQIRDALLEQAACIAAEPAVDAVEWRADHYEQVEDREAVVQTLRDLRRVLGELPILFTFRTQKEGGEREMERADYYALNLAAAESGAVDLVDVEIFTGEDVADHIAALHDCGVAVIGSKHDFHKTPSDDEMKSFLRRGWDVGADIPKLAVMPREHTDVLRLLNVTKAIHESCGKPIITISMSEIGIPSRMYGEAFGSAMTFGTVGQESAPGQLPAPYLRQVLDHLHETGKNKIE